MPNLCRVKRLGVVCIALVLSAVVQGQLVRPFHRHFSVPDGLPTVTVNDIEQDLDGQLWLATGNGLSRFDGVEFHNFKYRPGDPRSVPDEYMSTIAVGRDGLLYAGGNAAMLCIVDPRMDTVSNIIIPGMDPDNMMESMISYIHCDRQGRVWIAHGSRKLTLYDPDTKTFITQDVAPERGGSIRCEIIMKIAEDEDGSLWLATMFGLVHFKPHPTPMEGEAGTPVRYMHPERIAPDPQYEALDHLTSVLDRGDSLLVSTNDQGIYVFHKATQQRRWIWRGNADSSAEQDLVVADMNGGPDNSVWLVGSKAGIRSLSIQDGQVRAFDRDLNPNRVDQRIPLFPAAKYIIRDDQGNVWCGSETDGLLLIPVRGEHFRGVFLDPEAADANRAVTVFKTVHDTSSGKTYVLTVSGQGMYVVAPDGTSIKRLLPEGMDALIISDMAFAPSGEVYVSTGAGLFLFDRGTDTFSRPMIANDAHHSLDKKIQRLALDEQGRVWMARGNLEPHRYDPTDGTVTGLFTLAPEAAKLATGNVSYVDVDPAGRLWFAGHTTMPFIVLTNGQCVPLPIRDDGEATPSLFYYGGVTFTSDGSAWIGALREGVMRYTFQGDRPIREEVLTAVHGLSTDQVTRIASDKEGRIWIATLNGLDRYDPSDRTFRTFSITDGLARMELIRGMSISDDGRWVAVGTENGYSYLDLDKGIDVRIPPRVRFRSMSVFGDRIPLSDGKNGTAPVQLTHQQHQVTFLIRSNELAHASEIVYAYRLRDVDTTWTDVGGEERIAMAHLPPGDHLFEVRARQGDGPWGPVSTVRFIIAPPWWATWWFRILIVVLSMGMVALVFRWRLSKRTDAIEQRYAREQALADERLRIANDLHDELGSGLSVIKVKSQLALERPNTNPAAEVLQQVANSSSELIDSMRQIIWTIRSGQSGLLDLLAYVRSYATGYLDDHDVACSFEVDDAMKDRELSVEQRRALLLILKEALHNVVKHAAATRVTISVSCTDLLRFSIADDGSGMEAPIQVGPANGVGLQSMERRARSIGGKLTVHSEKGTTITVEIPLPPERTGPNVPLERSRRTDNFA